MFSTKSLISLLVLEQVISFASAKIFSGACSKPTLQEDFNLTSYAGFWYEIYRDPGFFWEKGATCATANYVPNQDGSIKVINSQVKNGDNKVDSMTGTAACEGAQCYVEFFKPIKGDYRVIATDYEKYSIVYSCENLFGLFHKSYLWVLSKEETIDSTVLSFVESTIAKEVDDWKLEDLYATPQGGSCIYATPQ